MRFTIASALRGEVCVTKNLVYLDLARGVEDRAPISPELISKNLPVAVGYLDLALSRNTILVPHGQTKMFNKLILKNKGSCGQFVLFPNLPKELQNDIFKYCYQQEPRQISFIEMEATDSTRWIQPIGARRPTIFAASKVALLDALALKIYVPMFATVGSTRKYYFSVGHDWLELGHYQLSNCPQLELVDALVNKSDMNSFQVLHMSHDGVFLDEAWCSANMLSLPNVETLHITASFPDPGRAHRGCYILWFREVYGSRNTFMQFCNRPDGREVELQDALNTFDSYICSKYEKLRIPQINTLLNRYLTCIPNFPLKVALIVEYLPVPGYPLATIQPRCQHT